MTEPIICFEGPSGIGKTTLSHRLADDYCIVPEVNLLFQRTEPEPKYWYLERQVERYHLCQQSNKKAILDGDIFQAVWYPWACHYPANFLPQKETHQFYRSQLLDKKIAFPDLYIIFQIEEKELWIRKEQDQTRQRRNFKKHLKIIEPLQKYYQFLDQETEIEIRFIEYIDLDTTQKKVQTLIENWTKTKLNHLQAFEQITHWLKHNKSSAKL